MPNTVTTPIERAIARGDFEEFARLLPEVEDLNAIVTARGDTLLGRACIQTSGQKFVAGHRRFIDKLLQRGADPHLPARNGLTALGLAAWHGDWQSMNVLFESDIEAEIWSEVIAVADETRFREQIERKPELAWAVCNHSGWDDRPVWTPLELLSTSRLWRCDLELRKTRGQNREVVSRVTGTSKPDVGARMARMVSFVLGVHVPAGTDRQACLDFGLSRASNWGSKEIATLLTAAGANPG